MARTFALLARAYCSPKFQLWCLCEELKASDGNPDSLQFPVEIRIHSAPVLVCPASLRCNIATSDELATTVARASLAGVWSAWEMEYKLSGDDHLLGMIVSGKGDELPRTAPRGRGAPRNTDLTALREALREDDLVMPKRPKAKARQRHSATGEVEGRGRRRGGGERGNSSGGGRPGGAAQAQGAEAAGELEAQDGALDEMPPFQVVDLDDPIDQAEVLEAAGWLGAPDGAGAAPIPPAQDESEQEQVDVAPGEPDEPDGQGEPALVAHVVGGVAEDAPYGPPTPLESGLIRGPGPLGYFEDRTGRSMLRVTEKFKTSVGVKCLQHLGKCTLAMAKWRLPSRMALAALALNATPFPDHATRDEKHRIIQVYLQELRVMRDAAVALGRTRQSLLDEAAAERAPPM